MRTKGGLPPAGTLLAALVLMGGVALVLAGQRWLPSWLVLGVVMVLLTGLLGLVVGRFVREPGRPERGSTTVVLEAVGPRPIQVLKVLRVVRDDDFRTVRDALWHGPVPQVAVRGVSDDAAARIVAALGRAGATASPRPSMADELDDALGTPDDQRA